MIDLRKKSLSSTSMLVLTLFLAGCAVGPDFEKPEAPKVGSYAPKGDITETVASESTAGKAQKIVSGKDIQGDWWRVFQSEPLNKLIDMALANNPSLKSAEASLSEAQNTLYAGEGAFLPTATAGGSITRQKTSGRTASSSNGKGSIYNLNSASVDVSYSLDLWGGVRRSVEALDAEATYKRFQMEGAYLSLTANVVTSAVQEASLRAQVEATKEIAEAQRKQLDLVRKQLELGAVSRTSVLTQETTLANTEASLPALEKQLAQTRNALTVLAGQYPSEELESTFSLATLHLPEELPLSVPSKLVEQRPDIQAAEALMHQAMANIGIATANMLPQITLSGNMGSSAEKLSKLFFPGGGVWGLGASASQTLFDSGSLFFKREAAKDAFDAASASYKSTVLSAFQDVADTLKALEMDARTLAAQQVAEKAAAATLEIADRQFKVGAISYLSMLTAQQNYQNAKIALIKAEAARFADTAALFQAMGGGWWNRTEDVSDNSEAESKKPQQTVPVDAPKSEVVDNANKGELAADTNKDAAEGSDKKDVNQEKPSTDTKDKTVLDDGEKV